MFARLFGRKRNRRLGDKRKSQFRRAWLLANRGFQDSLAGIVEVPANEDANKAVKEYAGLTCVEIAQRLISEQMPGDSPEERSAVEFASQLLPVVDEMHQRFNPSTGDAELSFMHNAMATRVLEFIMLEVADGKAPTCIEIPREFDVAEREILAATITVIDGFWA